jgi:hypothetical protein
MGRQMPIRGAVDEVTSKGAQGWIHGADGPMTVRAMLDGRVLAKGTADRLRPDLAAAGIGDGRCGFHLTFGEQVDPLHLPFISVKPEAGDVDLPRTGLTGFRDILKAASERKPAAGRPRSVYGNLWIDRTDAPALLKSKLRIGQLPLALAPGLESLIREGAVLMDCEGECAKPGASPAEAAAQLVKAPRLVALLRATLEDVPMVVFATGVEAQGYSQPSTWMDLPAPTECLGLLAAPPNASIKVGVVRDSHTWPEFRQDGQSRWCAPGALPAPAYLAQAVVEPVTVGPNQMLVVGPGAVISIGEAVPGAFRMLCVPVRAAPASAQGGPIADHRQHRPAG